ncbi:MAG: CopG family transcriptional regulator [Solirubrobacterales bacterium]
MKRLQISLEPELDEQLGQMAREGGISKAEVVRRSLRANIEPPGRLADDPLFQLRFSGGGLKPGETIDDVVYGRKGSPR